MENSIELGGEVVHESIADATRTRHMWQQMAAAQNPESRTNGPSRSSTPAATRSASIPSNGHGGHLGNGFGRENQQANAWRGGNHAQMDGQTQQHRPNLWQNGHHATNSAAPSPVISDAALENEKRMFMAYMLSHPEVVSSLGVTIPWQTRQRYQQYSPNGNVKIELKMMSAEMDDCYLPKTQLNGRSSSVASNNGKSMEKENFNQTYGHGITDRNTQHQQQTYQAAGRYIKNNHAGPQSNGNIQPSNGWQKRIIRRQSQVASEAIEASLPKLESSTTPRHWKIGQSNEQESPIQKKAPTHFEAGEFVDESGQVYKSMGESIIAKEIREYREREEELRRSRSQLGLPSLEDMLDDYKNNVKGGKAERSHSVDHLQAAVEEERYPSPAGNRNRSGSMSHVNRMAENLAPGHPPLQQNRFVPIGRLSNGGKNVYGSSQAHNQNGGYPRQPKPPSLESDSPNFSPVNGRKKSRESLSPMEARIEREVDELRRREEELRLHREAAGVRLPTSIQPSPIASSASPANSNSSSNFSGAITDRNSHDYAANWKNNNKQPLHGQSKSTITNSRIPFIHGDVSVHSHAMPPNENCAKSSREFVSSGPHERMAGLHASLQKSRQLLKHEPITVMVDNDPNAPTIKVDYGQNGMQNSTVITHRNDQLVSARSDESSEICNTEYLENADINETQSEDHAMEDGPQSNKNWNVEDILVSI